MATTPPYININSNENQVIVWNPNTTGSTGSSILLKNIFFNSNQEIQSTTTTSFFNNYLDKDFIKFDISLREQFERKKEFLDGFDYPSINILMKKSLVELLNFNPDKLSLELSAEKNLFYTLIKGNLTFFISHSLDSNPNDSDEDEIIISVFRNKQKLPSFSGSLIKGIDFLNPYLGTNELISFEPHV